jgi:aminoglycoside phosphotransferase (APT) family kinase protein
MHSNGCPTQERRQLVVDQLAAFLRALHGVPVDEILPDEVAAFDPLAEWRDLYHRIRSRLFPAMRPDARDGVSRHFETFLGSPTNRQIRPTLVHGDFGTSNILYDPETGNVVGLIDFDSAGVGDPAVDLAAAYCYGLQRFAHVYPEVSAMANRVDFYRGTFALQEVLFGAENGDDVAYRAGMAAYVEDL